MNPVRSLKIASFIFCIVAIISFTFFAFKDAKIKREETKRQIEELILTKKALEETNATLQKQLEDEKKREKVVTQYIERKVFIEKKASERKSQVNNSSLQSSEDINKQYKEVMECFEKSC